MISAVVLLLFSVAAISPGNDAFIFGSNYRICTVLVTCPLSSYKFYVFPGLNQKLNANADFMNSNINQAWVEAPSPTLCNPPPRPGMICTILGGFDRVFEWYVFSNAQQKYRANEDLLWQSQGRGFYQAWVDAPQRYCQNTENIIDYVFSFI